MKASTISKASIALLLRDLPISLRPVAPTDSTAGSFASASVSRTCPSSASGICYSLNIPDDTASSGTGDIFFQISASTSYQWVALGQGSRMAGANIFVMYTSADGSNVTISPRSGTGHVLPEYNSDAAQLTLLEGSAVNNETMTANVRCSNCNSWNCGSTDFQSSSGGWIYAAKVGSSLNSDDLDEAIDFHDLYGTFAWDFSSAKGGNDVNPFLGGTAPSNPMNTAPVVSGLKSPGNLRQVMISHGVLACLAFVIFFPTGGILIRTAGFTGAVKIHITIQMLAYAMYIAAFGMGTWMASTLGLSSNKHAIIGYVVFALLLFQPVIGLTHHKVFKKTGHRNIWSVAHLSSGRIAIILGMINGGLGLQLANNFPMGVLIIYGVVAGVFGATYIAVVIFGESRRYSNKQSLASRDQEQSRGELKLEPGATTM